jgi:hypothetical protein
MGNGILVLASCCPIGFPLNAQVGWITVITGRVWCVRGCSKSTIAAGTRGCVRESNVQKKKYCSF